jgi:L-threonylcarbamoyladenylate synthase
MSAIEDALLIEGAVVLYPTGTVYGIGGSAFDAASVARVGKIKGRENLPLIVLVPATPNGLPPLAAALAERFWPGPLTMVLPNRWGYPKSVCAKDGTVAIRWSAHPVVQRLVDTVGPVTSTSANRHGDPPMLEVDDSIEVDAVIDIGRLPPSSPSTIINGVTGVVIRLGANAESVQRAIAIDLATLVAE